MSPSVTVTSRSDGGARIPGDSAGQFEFGSTTVMGADSGPTSRSVGYRGSSATPAMTATGALRNAAGWPSPPPAAPLMAAPLAPGAAGQFASPGADRSRDDPFSGGAEDKESLGSRFEDDGSGVAIQEEGRRDHANRVARLQGASAGGGHVTSKAPSWGGADAEGNWDDDDGRSSVTTGSAATWQQWDASRRRTSPAVARPVRRRTEPVGRQSPRLFRPTSDAFGDDPRRHLEFLTEQLQEKDRLLAGSLAEVRSLRVALEQERALRLSELATARQRAHKEFLHVLRAQGVAGVELLPYQASGWNIMSSIDGSDADPLGGGGGVRLRSDAFVDQGGVHLPRPSVHEPGATQQEFASQLMRTLQLVGNRNALGGLGNSGLHGPLPFSPIARLPPA